MTQTDDNIADQGGKRKTNTSVRCSPAVCSEGLVWKGHVCSVQLGDGNGTVELRGFTSLPMHCMSLAPELAVSPVWQSRRRCPAARLGLRSVPLPDQK